MGLSISKKVIQNEKDKQEQALKDQDALKSKSLAQLKFEWTLYVVQYVTSLKFHAEVIQNQIDIQEFLIKELGQDMKAEILSACEMIIKRFQEEYKKMKITEQQVQFVQNLITMLQECKKYSTILRRQKNLYTEQFIQLPLLLLCQLAEIFHIFLSLYKMYSSKESNIWFKYRKEDIPGCQIDYIENSSIINQQRKQNNVRKKAKMDIFDKNIAYFQFYYENIFSQLKYKMEKQLKEQLICYIEKQAEANSVKNQTQIGILYMNICENILSGKIKLKEDSTIYQLDDQYLDDLTLSIHLANNKINSLLPCLANRYFLKAKDY